MVCDDYLSPLLHEIDAAHRAARRPWLLAGVGSTAGWVGPLIRPYEGPCCTVSPTGCGDTAAPRNRCGAPSA